MKRSRDCSKEEEYISIVKAVFGDENRDKYQAFLQVLLDVKNVQTDFEEAKQRVNELFRGNNKDLIIGFNAFVPDGFQITVDEEPGRKNQKKEESYRADEVLNFLSDLKLLSNNDDNPNLYMVFLDLLRDHIDNEVPIEDVNNRVSFLLQNHQDLLKKFISFQPDSGKEIIDRVPERGSKQGTGFLDRLRSQKDDNPSYVRNNKHPPSNKLELVSQVINQTWIISKTVAKDSDEKADLRTKEDDLYEADMQLDLVRSTKECVEHLIKNPSLEVVKHMRGSNLRCIEHIYGDHRETFVNLLKDKITATRTLGVILERLEQAKQKCTEFRNQLRIEGLK